MNEPVSRLEFRAKVRTDSSVRIPPDVSGRVKPGQIVVVSIDTRTRRAQGAFHADDEVDRIARLQAEPVDAVRKCLEAQGSLARTPGISALLSVRGSGRAG